MVKTLRKERPPLTQMSKIACKHTLIVNKQGSMELKPAKIELKGNIISSVAICQEQDFSTKCKEWADVDPNLVVYKNKMITPAFINSHTHLAMNFFRGFNIESSSKKNMIEDLFYHIESQMTYEDIRAFVRMGAYECLQNGVGLVWDHYYFGQAVARALIDVGLSGVVAPTLQDLSGPGINSWEQELNVTNEIAQNEGYNERGIYAALGPHATDTVSPSLWSQILSISQKEELPIHMHLAQSAEEYSKITEKHNCTPVELLANLGIFESGIHNTIAHGIFIDRQNLKLIPSRQNTFIFCPFSALIFCFPANILEWHKQGKKWAVATDCVASNDSMNVQKELRYVSGFPLQSCSYSDNYKRFLDGERNSSEISLQRSSLWQDYKLFQNTPWLLNKIWKTPGSMHHRFKAGSIEPNYLANLAIWDLNDPSMWPSGELRPLAFGDTSSALCQMYIAGKPVSQNEHLGLSIKESQLFKEHKTEANRRFLDLTKRCGLS